jgi:hypothetical protein
MNFSAGAAMLAGRAATSLDYTLAQINDFGSSFDYSTASDLTLTADESFHDDSPNENA